MKRWVPWVLALIVVVAFFLRVLKAPSIPPSLSWDEASIGYNAYSILTTGRDEHGRFLPLDTFVAFGDYKPPLAIYATVPFVALLGLTELAVRLPSVIAGTLTVLITYFLVLELFSHQALSSKLKAPIKSKVQSSKIGEISHAADFRSLDFDPDLNFGFGNLDLRVIALLSAFLLAISPWHVQLSRAGFEGNIATFFVVFGVFLILRARKDPRLLAVSLLPFVASVYTFNSSRYFVPLLSLGLFIYARKDFRRYTGKILIGIVVATVALLPILGHLASPQSRLRFAEVNIFTDPSIVETANARIIAEGNTLWARILHNRRIGYFRSYLIHYFDNLQPWFLFIRGDGNPKFSQQDVGNLYLIDLPFLIIGILFLFRKEKKTAWFLCFWILASILPAATARETPHALRIEQSLPVWQILVAYGFVNFVSRLNVRRIPFGVALIALVYAGNVVFFLHNYFQHYSREFSGEWQYGYREAIRYATSVKGSYDTVILTESIGRPYIYVLFYEQFNPRDFWKTMDASFDAAGFYNVYGFDRYRFVRDGFKTSQGRVLYILPPDEVPGNASVLHTVTLLNGTPALVLFERT
jgi:hypothetical protein